MSTFQIRATVHASANSPRAAAWTNFTTSARLSISARKPIRSNKDSHRSAKSNAGQRAPAKLNQENIPNEQLNNIDNNEQQNILSSLQFAVITDSPIEINSFVNKQTINQRIESGSQSTSLSHLSTSPLPFDEENMPPQDFIAHSQVCGQELANTSGKRLSKVRPISNTEPMEGQTPPISRSLQEADDSDSSFKATPPTHSLRTHLAKLPHYQNSPSAFAAIRARQALLKTPVKYFDVPSEEQDIMTVEERQILSEVPKTIQQVMKDVVVYVEVHYEADNRSDGIKKVIAQLGAKVNNKLLRNTTHVVFKDGRLSTYKKAKLWDIPIVSILWIEACRCQVRLCNTSNYQISNKAWYDSRVAKSKIPSKRRLNADQSRRRKLLTTETFNTQVPASSEDEESSEYLTPVATEKVVDPTKRTHFNLDFEPDSPQLMQTLRSLHKKQMLEATQRSSSIETISRRALFNEDSNSFVGCQEFQPLPISSELVPKVGAAVLTPNTASVFNVSSESAITLSSETYDTSVGKNTPKTVPEVGSRKSMRSKVLHRTKYTPISMDFSECKGRSVSGRKSSVGMVLATPSRNNIAEKKDDVSVSDLTMDESSIFIAETQKMPVATPNMPRRSVNTRKSAMVLETPDKRSKAFVPVVPETPTTVMDITNRVDNVAESHMDLTLDESFVFTAQTQILPEDTRNKPIILDESSVFTAEIQIIPENACNKPGTPGRNIQYVAVVPSLTPSSCSELVTGNSASDTNSGKRRRTLFTPNKLIGIKRSNVIETQDQLLGDSPKTSESTKDKRSPRTHASKKRRSNSTDSAGGSVVLSANNRSISARDMRNITLPEVLDTSDDAIEAVVLTDKPLRRKLYVPPSLFDNSSATGPTHVDAVAVCVNNELPKTNDAAVIEKNQPNPKSISSQAKLSPSAAMLQKLLKNNRRRTSMDFETPETTIAPKPSKMKPAAAAIQYLVTTNLQRSQKEMVQKVIENLEGYKLELQVTRQTTHLITPSPQRTINMLRGIIRGAWILRFDWITESANAGKWLYEEPFEVRNFSRAISMCRIERQLFGNAYNLPLFDYFEPMYISKCCRCPDLRELIVSCLGRVTANKLRAKYIISDRLQSFGTSDMESFNGPDKLSRKFTHIHSSWILDSISLAKVQNIRPYVLMHDRPFVTPLVSFLTKG